MKKIILIAVLLFIVCAASCTEVNAPLNQMANDETILEESMSEVVVANPPIIDSDEMKLIYEERQFQESVYSAVRNFHEMTELQNSIPDCPEFFNPADWTAVSGECAYTSSEILELISAGDEITDVYAAIGYPQIRPYLLSDALCLGTDAYRFYFAYGDMKYCCSDGVWIYLTTSLAGYSDKDYRYVVTAIYTNGREILDAMERDELIAEDMIPLSSAVKVYGMDYMIEHGHLTAEDAVLYTAEQAVYEAAQAELAVEDTQPALSE